MVISQNPQYSTSVNEHIGSITNASATMNSIITTMTTSDKRDKKKRKTKVRFNILILPSLPFLLFALKLICWCVLWSIYTSRRSIRSPILLPLLSEVVAEEGGPIYSLDQVIYLFLQCWWESMLTITFGTSFAIDRNIYIYEFVSLPSQLVLFMWTRFFTVDYRLLPRRNGIVSYLFQINQLSIFIIYWFP